MHTIRLCISLTEHFVSKTIGLKAYVKGFKVRCYIKFEHKLVLECNAQQKYILILGARFRNFFFRFDIRLLEPLTNF